METPTNLAPSPLAVPRPQSIYRGRASEAAAGRPLAGQGPVRLGWPYEDHALEGGVWEILDCDEAAPPPLFITQPCISHPGPHLSKGRGADPASAEAYWRRVENVHLRFLYRSDQAQRSMATELRRRKATRDLHRLSPALRGGHDRPGYICDSW